jgi:hypothetical protein
MVFPLRLISVCSSQVKNVAAKRRGLARLASAAGSHLTPALRFGVIHGKNLLPDNRAIVKGACALAVKTGPSMVCAHPLVSMVPGVFGCCIGDVT